MTAHFPGLAQVFAINQRLSETCYWSPGFHKFHRKMLADMPSWIKDHFSL